MNDKRKTFPLPLSSVVGGGKTPAGHSPRAHRPNVAAPQTAMQNAAAASAPRTAWRPDDAGTNSVRSASEVLAADLQAAQAAAEDRANPLVSDAVRRAMVGRIARQGVRDETVLAAMTAVPRHLFIDSALAGQAYIDASLPIGHHQTISQPYIVARMIEVMRNGRDMNRVLEIGTGCGYQAAVLSCVAKEVYSIERIKPLHELAKNNLRPMRIANIRLQYGDGMLGLPQAAPFDGIILAAAGLEVPRDLLEQMQIGARLVAPVGTARQVLQLIERVGPYEWVKSDLEDCHFVPLCTGVV